jgi:hypothetical protein
MLVGVGPHQRFQPMPLPPYQRRSHAADHGELDKALDEVGKRLPGEQPLHAGAGGDFRQLRHQAFGRPHQPMLNQIAADGREHQQQERDRDGRQHVQGHPLQQHRQRIAVGRKCVRLSDDAAHGGGQRAPGRAGEGEQRKRRRADDEPGIDLLALDHIALADRFVEPSLTGVFCFFALVLLFRHRLAPSGHALGAIARSVPSK